MTLKLEEEYKIIEIANTYNKCPISPTEISRYVSYRLYTIRKVLKKKKKKI